MVDDGRPVVVFLFLVTANGRGSREVYLNAHWCLFLCYSLPWRSFDSVWLALLYSAFNCISLPCFLFVQFGVNLTAACCDMVFP